MNFFGIGVLALATLGNQNARPQLPLAPLPQSVHMGRGALTLLGPTIVATSEVLLPVAGVLADDLKASTGIHPTISRKPIDGSIVLRIDPKLAPEAYRIDIDRNVAISAATARGLTYGAVTLLQAVETKNGRLIVPRMRIEDRPDRPYRGLMIDVARRYHTIGVLKQCVMLCHLYKLNFLQLHLSDDQAFTFPSKAFPLINNQNQHGGPSYTLTELKDLVKFADDRGVTIVPEMDIPGHSATLNRAMPDLFKIKGTKPYEHHATINFANKDVLKAIDTLVGEMCDVFKSSPYFHMGGDEADFALADQHPDFQAEFKKLGLPPKSQQELFRRFIDQVDEMVKKRHKKLIVWEGFGRNPQSKFPISKDILVMEFENAYYLPAELLQDGYSLVNASWTPLYVVNRHVWPARKVYDWDLSKFGRFSNLYPTTTWLTVPDTKPIVGAEVCSWEGPEELEIQNLRRIVPAMAERIWNPVAGNFGQFERRLRSTDAVLERLVHPVGISTSAFDAVDPNGYDVPCFTEPLTVRLEKGMEATLRYTLDGKPPVKASPEYDGPITIHQTTTVRARLYDSSGHPVGFESSMAFYYVPPHMPNLATGKKVTVSGGTQAPQNPELAVDDNLDLSSSWWASPAPQWLQVDLGKVYTVDRIEVFPYWDGRRYYQYTVDVSADGKTWSTVADRSQNTKPSSSQGDEIRFDPQQVRYVKVNMLRGSANEGVHLVELRVWEHKRP